MTNWFFLEKTCITSKLTLRLFRISRISYLRWQLGFSDWTPAHASVCHTYRKVFLSNYTSTSFNLIHLKYDTACKATISIYNPTIWLKRRIWAAISMTLESSTLTFALSRVKITWIWDLIAWLISSVWMNWCVAL